MINLETMLLLSWKLLIAQYQTQICNCFCRDFSLLNKDEWETLSGFIPCDKEISLINLLQTQEEGSSMLALTPGKDS